MIQYDRKKQVLKILYKKQLNNIYSTIKTASISVLVFKVNFLYTGRVLR